MKKNTAVDASQLHELLYQALETELGGVKIYETALRCAVNDDLRKSGRNTSSRPAPTSRWSRTCCETLGLDPATMTPGRKVVGHIGASLVEAMEMALKAGDKAAAELVACECVVLAETKDHANWELIGHVAKHGKGEEAKVLKAAYDAVEEDEDHHLYHTTAGAGNCGSSRSACPRCCRRRKRSSRSRPRSAPRARSRRATRCSSRLNAFSDVHKMLTARLFSSSPRRWRPLPQT